MATAAEPANNVMTINGVRVASQTQAGTDYVNKVTHPPSTIPSGYCGVPDASHPNFVPLEVKCSDNVRIDYTLPDSATTTVNNLSSRLLFVQPSGGFVGSYVFHWTGSAWVQAANQGSSSTMPAITTNQPATKNVGYNFDNYVKDISTQRTVYKSTTTYLNATGFNNQGVNADAKFKPDVLHTSFSALRRDLNTDDERERFDALVCQLLGKEPVDIEVVSGRNVTTKRVSPLQATDFDYDVQVWDWANGTGTIAQLPNSVMYSIAGLLPETPADVIVSSPKGIEREAKLGGFTVEQPVDPVQLWTPNADNSRATGPQNPAGCTFSIIRCNNGSTISFAPLYNAASSGGFNGAADTPWNNLTWSYQMYDGLTVASSDVVNAIGAPYITVKGYTGIEGQARSTGSLQSFQKMLPLPDPEALQMAVGIHHARPDGLPAAANDFGTIAAVAAKFLPTVIPWIASLFSKNKSQTPAALPQQQRNGGRTRRLNALMRNVNLGLPSGGTVLPTFQNSTAFGNAAQVATPTNTPIGIQRNALPNPRRRRRNRPTTRIQVIEPVQPVVVTPRRQLAAVPRPIQAPLPQRRRRLNRTVNLSRYLATN